MQEERELTGSLKDLIKIRRHFINLIVLIFIWMGASFNLYLLHYNTKKLPGDFFANSMISSLTDLPVTLLGGFVYYWLGPRWSFTLTFTLALSGGLCILALGDAHPDFEPYMLSMAKTGIKVTLDICFLANAQLFPAIFAGTAYGLCNVGAKIAAIFSPMLAEFDAPTPMILFCSVGGVALVISFFIRP